MRIIGIDPGTGILGFGVIEVDARGNPKMITAGVITTPAHTPLDDRLLEIFDSLTEIIAETNPEVMSIRKAVLRNKMSRLLFLCPMPGAWLCLLASRQG